MAGGGTLYRAIEATGALEVKVGSDWLTGVRMMIVRCSNDGWAYERLR